MLITLTASYKSLPKGLSFELPKFCVLTGRNGSGKSHLLEAIAGNHANVVENGIRFSGIHHVGFNGLNPQVDEQCDANQVIAGVTTLWSQIQSYATNYRNVIAQGSRFNDVVTEYLPQHHGHNPALYAAIGKVLQKSKKDLASVTQEDVLQNISFAQMAQNQNQLFFSQCALIFKGYHTRKSKNEFAQFRASKGGLQKPTFLTDDEFKDKYGPPPWELINQILKSANLPYQVTDPESGDVDLPYRLRLIDSKQGVDIPVNDLSTGEKVLMSLALAIYNTQEDGGKPELLLLDEPDAPLHPQFSKLLIDTVVSSIVEKAGVNVILTTHSPSTVAMAPADAIFEIDRVSKIPRNVTPSHAVEILTEGIAYLRVSYEKRRQVFVESRYDVMYYERIKTIVGRRHAMEYELVFLEPHSGSSNCTDVISIVNQLRSSGSDLAYGLIDYDAQNAASKSIVVLGGGARYAVENYILDPVYIALALIRSGKLNFSQFGIVGKNTYADTANLTASECQQLIDSVLSTCGIAITDLAQSQAENGYILNYPAAFLMHQGHEYEKLLNTSFPELNVISRGKGDSALKLGVLQVIDEYPQYFPAEVAVSLTQLAGLQRLND